MPDDRFNEYCEALLAQYTRKNTQTVTQRLPAKSPQFSLTRPAFYTQSAQERNESKGGHPGETPPGQLEVPAESPTRLKRDCPGS